MSDFMNKILQGSSISLESIKRKCALESGCHECKGRGYIIEDGGFVLKAKLCHCVTNCPSCQGSCKNLQNGLTRSCLNVEGKDPKRIVNIFNAADLPSRFFDADLIKFSNNTGNCKKIVSEIMVWVKDYINGVQSKGFVLSGDVGVGKTYILVAVAKKLASYGVDVKFVDFHELLNVIKSGYAEDRSEETVIGPLVKAQVLCIDELAKGRNTDWEQEKLDQLIMRRYNANKVSIYSTNYSLKEEDSSGSNFLDEYQYQDEESRFNPSVFGSLEKRIGSRIFSRLVETSLMIEIQGSDYRKILAKSK